MPPARVVGERHRRDRGPTQALLGDEAQSEPSTCGRAEPRGGSSAHAYRRAVRRRPFARQGREQLLLAIAGNSGDAEDFAAAHGQPDIGQVGAERIV